MNFSNVITNCDHFKIVCLTETWLVPEISDGALFLSRFVIHHNDRPSNDGHTKHGGVLEAIDSSVQHKRIELDPKFTETVVEQIMFNDYCCLLCCIYCAPHQSSYRHSPVLLCELLDSLNRLSSELITSLTLIVGDINFNLTNWSCISKVLETHLCKTLHRNWT